MELTAWIIIGIFAAVAEAMTVSVVSIWFVVGAVGGGVALALGAPFWLQCIIFLGTSGICILAIRKLVLASLNKRKKELPIENATVMESKIGIVTQTIKPGLEGQIKVDGEFWIAMALDSNETIEEGTQVVVCKQAGVKCIVTELDV